MLPYNLNIAGQVDLDIKIPNVRVAADQRRFGFLTGGVDGSIDGNMAEVKGRRDRYVT